MRLQVTPPPSTGRLPMFDLAKKGDRPFTGKPRCHGQPQPELIGFQFTLSRMTILEGNSPFPAQPFHYRPPHLGRRGRGHSPHRTFQHPVPGVPQHYMPDLVAYSKGQVLGVAAAESYEGIT